MTRAKPFIANHTRSPMVRVGATIDTPWYSRINWTNIGPGLVGAGIGAAFFTPRLMAAAIFGTVAFGSAAISDYMCSKQYSGGSP